MICALKNRPGIEKLLKKSLIFILLIAAWHALSSMGLLNHAILPSPLDVTAALIAGLRNGELLLHILHSLKRVVMGFLIAVITGIAAGMLLGTNKRLAGYITPLMDFLRPIPPVAWIPLAILWFGVGDSTSYFLVFLGAFFPIFTNTHDGARSVSINHIRAAKNLGANATTLLLHVLFPAALPNIFTGLRTGLGVGWMCLITAELVASASGLGYMIQLNRLLLQTDNVILGMIVIGIIGLAMNRLMLLAQKMAVPWRYSHEG